MTKSIVMLKGEAMEKMNNQQNEESNEPKIIKGDIIDENIFSIEEIEIEEISIDGICGVY